MPLLGAMAGNHGWVPWCHGRKPWWGAITTLPFISSFFAFRSAGFCLRAWPSGHGFRGNTPLLLAVQYGHDGMVERLLEAKATVDVQDNNGRGLGREFGGRPRGAWDCCGEVDGTLIVQFFLGYFFFTCLGKWAQTCAPTL